MKYLTILLLFAGCIPALDAQFCVPLEVEHIDFQVTPRFVKVKAEWYSTWIEYHHGEKVYPESIEPLTKWKHPFMKDNLPSAMKEDSYA